MNKSVCGGSLEWLECEDREAVGYKVIKQESSTFSTYQVSLDELTEVTNHLVSTSKKKAESNVKTQRIDQYAKRV